MTTLTARTSPENPSPSLGAGPSPQGSGGSLPIASLEDLGRTFNTALLTSLSRSSQGCSEEIQSAMDTQAFHSLLSSIRHLSRAQGISEAAAAEEIIRTVRRLDSAWRDYVFQQGLERLKSSE